MARAFVALWICSGGCEDWARALELEKIEGYGVFLPTVDTFALLVAWPEFAKGPVDFVGTRFEPEVDAMYLLPLTYYRFESKPPESVVSATAVYGCPVYGDVDVCLRKLLPDVSWTRIWPLRDAADSYLMALRLEDCIILFWSTRLKGLAPPNCLWELRPTVSLAPEGVFRAEFFRMGVFMAACCPLVCFDVYCETPLLVESRR